MSRKLQEPVTPPVVLGKKTILLNPKPNPLTLPPNNAGGPFFAGPSFA